MRHLRHLSELQALVDLPAGAKALGYIWKRRGKERKTYNGARSCTCPSRLLLNPIILSRHLLPHPSIRITCTVVTSKSLKCSTLGLWDTERCEATKQHEESIYLHNMVLPRACSSSCGTGLRSPGCETRKPSLPDDRTDLSRASRDSVGGGAVASWKAFTRDDERRCVGT
jgi:hypothetical protein